MSTQIDFTGSLNDDETRVALNLPRKILTTSTGIALTSGFVARTEAEPCSYNALLDIDRKRLLYQASLVVLPSTYGEGRLFSQKPVYNSNGTFTFTRATTATRVNSAGLVELVPYNLLQYSEQFDNGVWVKTATSITDNTTTAPDGTLTADKLISTSVSSSHSIYQNLGSVGDTRVISCFVKKAEYRYVNLQYGTAFARFDFDTLTFSGGTSNTYTDEGNGWYRISSLLTATVNARATILIPDNSGNISYVGDDVSGTFIWGAQAVEGTNALPYQKTETRLNIPRLDYSLGGCPNILLEPQRTNLQPQSNGFLSNWTKDEVTTSVGESTLISGQTTTLVTETAINAVHRLIPTAPITLLIGTVYTISFYAKSNGTRNIGIRTGITGTSQNVIFNPNTQTTVSIPVGFTTKITAANSGYYRYEITATSAVTLDSCSVVMFNGASIAYLGTSESLYISAFQYEAGSYPTSYIPTTSASVTRNVDVISKTGISSLIGQTEGTIFLDIVFKNPISSINRPISITETVWSSGGSIRLEVTSSQFVADIVNAGASVGAITYLTSVLPNTRYKIAIAYKQNDCKMYINGVQVGSDITTGVMPTCSELYLNNLGGTFSGPYEANAFNATALWKEALTNDQLEALTGTGFDTYAAMASFYNYTLQ